MDRWERITRRILVLTDFGLDTQLFRLHVDEEGFLEDEWLERWYGESLPSYVADELAAIDLLDQARDRT